MSRRSLISPARNEDSKPPPPTAASSASAFIDQVERGLQRISDVLSTAVEEAEQQQQHTSSSQSPRLTCSSSSSRSPEATSRTALLAAVNTYRSACLSSLTALHALATAAAAVPPRREGDATAMADVATLEQQLARQKIESADVEARLRARLADMDSTVRALQAQQNTDYAQLEACVSSAVTRAASSSPPPPRDRVVAQSDSAPSTDTMCRWWAVTLMSMESEARAQLGAQEAAERELVAHRRLLARAVVRVQTRGVPRDTESDGLEAQQQQQQQQPQQSHKDPQRDGQWHLSTLTGEPVPNASPTRDESALEEDVRRMAEYAATLHQNLSLQRTELRGAVEATRQSMEAVHVRALAQLAARHTEECGILEERLAGFMTALAALRARRDREAAQQSQREKTVRAAADAAEARVEQLTGQLTAAKKRVWHAELAKDQLHARLSVLQRQLDDTVPRTRGQRSHGVSAYAQHEPQLQSDDDGDDDDEAREENTQKDHDGDDVSPRAMRDVDPSVNPGRLFEGYRDDEDDENGGLASSPFRVHPSVWHRPSSTGSSPAITITAVHPPSSTRTSGEEGLVLSPHGTPASAIHMPKSSRVAGGAASTACQTMSHTTMMKRGADDSAMPSPPKWASSSSLMNSPVPKPPSSVQREVPSTKTATIHAADSDDGSGDVRVRLEAVYSTLVKKQRALDEEMQLHTTTHQVRRRQRQHEARHLLATRHYYEHALSTTTTRPHHHPMTASSAAAMAAAESQLDAICAQLAALDAESAAEEEAFERTMAAARGRYDELCALLQQVDAKRAMLSR